MERKDLLILGGVAAGAFAVGGLAMKLYQKPSNFATPTKTFVHTPPPVIKYMMDNSMRENPILQELQEYTIANVDLYIMLSDPVQVQFMQLMLKAINAKKCLEVGMFTGHNALSCALTIPDDGEVYALDISEKYVSHGRPFFEKAKVAHKITTMIAPASESLDKLIAEGHSGTFDFAYIDADKTGYKDYYEKCLVLLRKGGIIIFDNMIFGGTVIDLTLCRDSTRKEDPLALRELAGNLKSDERVDVSFVNIGDGTYIAMKR